MLGGPLGDRIGRKRVIWISHPSASLPSPCCCPRRPVLDLGAVDRHRPHPGVGLLRHPGLRPGSGPRQVGTISGLFFGFAFGMGGIGPPCWADWPTPPASKPSIRSAPICPYWPADRLPAQYQERLEANRQPATDHKKRGLSRPRLVHHSGRLTRPYPLGLIRRASLSAIRPLPSPTAGTHWKLSPERPLTGTIHRMGCGIPQQYWPATQPDDQAHWKL